MKKNDYLITLIGSNPMPNLISAYTRIKENSTIFMIYTKETKKIAEQLKFLIEERSKESNLNVSVKLDYGQIYSEYDIQEVNKELTVILNNIKEKYLLDSEKDKSIEFNFTAGTKIMSSVGYTLFKKIFKDENSFLSYLDGEESKVRVYDVKNEKDYSINYCDLDETIKLTIDDIIQSHFYTSGGKNEFKHEKYEDANISEVNEYIYKSFIENYDNRDEFIKLMEQMNKIKDKKYIKNNIDVINKQLESSIIKINNFNNFSQIIDKYKSEFPELAEKKIYKLICEDLRGKWLEKVLFNRLQKYKNDKYIDDVVLSEARDNGFEIDLLILKNKQLYCISVTTDDSYIDVDMKLHEIKYRAKSIGGEEVKIGLISFYESNDKLRSRLKNVWDKDSLKSKYLVIALDNFLDLGKKLFEFLS